MACPCHACMTALRIDLPHSPFPGLSQKCDRRSRGHDTFRNVPPWPRTSPKPMEEEPSAQHNASINGPLFSFTYPTFSITAIGLTLQPLFLHAPAPQPLHRETGAVVLIRRIVNPPDLDHQTPLLLSFNESACLKQAPLLTGWLRSEQGKKQAAH